MTSNQIILLSVMLVLTSCASPPSMTKQKNTKKNTDPTVFEHQYYQDLGKNISRLYHLMQGTFVAYQNTEDTPLKAWSVAEGDSVVLYITPLGDVAKHGYWTYSYEFMTSLPNEPIYVSIKQLKQVDRDTLEVLYYKSPVKLKLSEVLNQELLNEKIQLDNLERINKRAVYVRQSASNFIGKSIVYEDSDHKCFRQNNYNIKPNFYEVQARYFDEGMKERFDIKKRPNFLIRRSIAPKVLDRIAKKDNLKH